MPIPGRQRNALPALHSGDPVTRAPGGNDFLLNQAVGQVGDIPPGDARKAARVILAASLDTHPDDGVEHARLIADMLGLDLKEQP